MTSLDKETKFKDWYILLFSFFPKRRISDPANHPTWKSFSENS